MSGIVIDMEFLLATEKNLAAQELDILAAVHRLEGAKLLLAQLKERLSEPEPGPETEEVAQ